MTNQTVFAERVFQTDDYAETFAVFQIEFDAELIDRIKRCMQFCKDNPWVHNINIDDYSVTPMDESEDTEGVWEETNDVYFDCCGIRVYTNAFYAWGQSKYTAQDQYESARMVFGDNDTVIVDQ